jgi:hypothetical protein
MQGQINKEASSGTVRLQGDVIFWDFGNKNISQINVNDIVVVGEYTNSDGPYFDDWFLVFVTQDGQWHAISWYADNIDDTTRYLSEKFHEDLNGSHLANSTEWKSIVRYPTYLKDKPLFILTPSDTYKIPVSFLDKILSSIGFGNFDTTQNISLTEDVKNELTKAR